MELGGKSALLVFEDADVEKAVEWAMVSLKCDNKYDVVVAVTRV